MIEKVVLIFHFGGKAVCYGKFASLLFCGLYGWIEIEHRSSVRFVVH